ncbi:MAG TPA: CPBP family intramembrane glutamic endopeptidase [Candidatus Nanopelagicales bacterium]|nr:CPBP family intramembrane glutamic endopeptidase [Candidatus Nanopelagicales bacterium]
MNAPLDPAFEARLTDPREPPRATRAEALLIAAGVTVATAAGNAWAFSPSRAGAADTLSSLAAVYVPAAALTALWLRRRGELRSMLRPLGGDLALGFLIAALLYAAALGASLLFMPHGSAREAWILRFYLHLGGPEEVGRVAVGGAVFVIAALEEVVWRGLAMRALAGPFGAVGAWLPSAALYGAAHLPTAVLLGGPEAGLNPLLPLAALGCGLVWGRLLLLKGRLVPALFAHAFFSWAVASFPIWRP